MRILIISFNFPPFNASGSIRVGKFARYLADRGHDVRVVAGDGLPFPSTFLMPFDDVRVERVGYWRVEAPIDWARRRSGAGALAPATSDTTPDPNLPVGLRNAISHAAHGAVSLYRAALAVPDGQVGWIRGALAAARRLTADWTPDVIVSSALPFSCHVVGSRIAQELKRPWIADFRDLFADNPYNFVAPWRRVIDRALERHTLRGVAGCTTVSQPLAEALRQAHGCEVAVILNGFDPGDVVPDAAPPRYLPARPIKILYTGIIYPGRRDPRPLFEALAAMGADGRRFQVDFYGQDLRGVKSMADKTGVGHLINVTPPVAYRAALRLQQEADLLLLLLWDDPKERGVFTGKLFEYAGAGRPILSIGSIDGVAAELISERQLGVAVNGVDQVATALRKWLDEYDRHGHIAGPGLDARRGLSREEQFTAYENFIARFV